jgi:hypothetical protein
MIQSATIEIYENFESHMDLNIFDIQFLIRCPVSLSLPYSFILKRDHITLQFLLAFGFHVLNNH